MRREGSWGRRPPLCSLLTPPPPPPVHLSAAADLGKSHLALLGKQPPHWAQLALIWPLITISPPSATPLCLSFSSCRHNFTFFFVKKGRAKKCVFVFCAFFFTARNKTMGGSRGEKREGGNKVAACVPPSSLLPRQKN